MLIRDWSSYWYVCVSHMNRIREESNGAGIPSFVSIHWVRNAIYVYFTVYSPESGHLHVMCGPPGAPDPQPHWCLPCTQQKNSQSNSEIGEEWHFVLSTCSRWHDSAFVRRGLEHNFSYGSLFQSKKKKEKKIFILNKKLESEWFQIWEFSVNSWQK